MSNWLFLPAVLNVINPRVRARESCLSAATIVTTQHRPHHAGAVLSGRVLTLHSRPQPDAAPRKSNPERQPNFCRATTNSASLGIPILSAKSTPIGVPSVQFGTVSMPAVWSVVQILIRICISSFSSRSSEYLTTAVQYPRCCLHFLRRRSAIPFIRSELLGTFLSVGPWRCSAASRASWRSERGG